jgi:hypothetical protein
MSHNVRSDSTLRGCTRRLALALAMTALAFSDGRAQQVGEAPQFSVSRHVAAPLSGPERPPLLRVAGHTLAGGVAGGALGLAVASTMPDDGGFVSTRDLAMVFAAAGGYVLGSAIGAQRSVGTLEGRPSLARMIVTSALAAAAGGVLWNRIGEGFERDDPGIVDHSSWYAGAAAGVVLHISLTSVVAQRSARRPPR